MIVEPFTEDRSEEWDDLVERAPMATFLHSRRFLSYHGDRFADASVVLLEEGGTLRGVLPAALDPGDRQRVVSHPGATYGGLIHDGGLNGDRAVAALRGLRAHYADRDLGALLYKPVPHIYHRSPSADDVWALCELGAVRIGCDLSSAIELGARRRPTQRRERSLRKARESGVEVADDPGALAALWPVVEAALEQRHNALPVHTLGEIELLQSRFPGAIRPVVALMEGRVIAGVVLFVTPTVIHTQYIAASERGMETSALDAVIQKSIDLAGEAGVRYFDFGISPGEGRRGLLPGLYRWKAEFGGGGVLHEHYELALAGANSPA
jgi:CelD/BcsL family acetyltransferase involved in cellulose biosynthesis